MSPHKRLFIRADYFQQALGKPPAQRLDAFVFPPTGRPRVRSNPYLCSRLSGQIANPSSLSPGTPHGTPQTSQLSSGFRRNDARQSSQMGSRLAVVSSDSQVRQSLGKITLANATDNLPDIRDREGSAACIAMSRQASARLL
jgi:hypothetical protein